MVAVHGLGGDSFSTWTDGSSNILWLRDLLPKSSYFANCRIFTFGYDAKKWLTPLEPSKGRVFTFAEDLLTALRSKRILTGSIGRPIAFIGHSLGGIVIKKVSYNKCFNPFHRPILRRSSIRFADVSPLSGACHCPPSPFTLWRHRRLYQIDYIFRNSTSGVKNGGLGYLSRKHLQGGWG